jgi:uncharacterized membrane protein
VKRWSFAPRRIFVAGLLVTLPGVVSVYLLYIAFSYFDGLLQPMLRRAPQAQIPGLGLAVLAAVVFLVGLLTSNLLGARLVSLLSRAVEKIPVFSPLYRGVREISQVFLGEQAKAFRRVGLLEWPRPGHHALVFVMSESSGTVDESLGQRQLTVFLPTTPNPTTGFVLFVPPERVVPLDMSVEQALKVCLSAGAVAVPGPEAGVPWRAIDPTPGSEPLQRA